MDNIKKLDQSLDNIDKISNQVIKKLTILHDRKIGLIKNYLLSGDNDKLKQIRKDLQKNY